MSKQTAITTGQAVGAAAGLAAIIGTGGAAAPFVAAGAPIAGMGVGEMIGSPSPYASQVGVYQPQKFGKYSQFGMMGNGATP